MPAASDQGQSSTAAAATGEGGPFRAPAIAVPKGGGAIRGIGEKFAANPVTGTGSLTVPIAASPGRSGFGPKLALSYDSGAGNGPFGFGWNLSLPSVTRKTDKGLPRYVDAQDSDEFLLSGAEDLVPVLVEQDGHWVRQELPPRVIDGRTYLIRRYRPRIEGTFARIERWTNQVDPSDCFWRSISRDNVTTWYGKTEQSRVRDPTDATRIFSWLISASYDDKGNAIVYEYKPEDSVGVDSSQAHERNRSPASRSADRHLKRIKYGNRTPNRDAQWLATDPHDIEGWLFELVFDYGEHGALCPRPDDDQPWLCRHDAFSSYRAGFEIRTYRLCQRVLMFHHFPDEADVGRDCLVRSTDLTYRSTRNNPHDRHKGDPIGAFLAEVTQAGYRRVGDGYLHKALPPLEFEYSQATISAQVQEADAATLVNLPIGVDGRDYQWIDLDGEGLSGILSQQRGAWLYKPALGEGRFGPLQTVRAVPAAAAQGERRHQFLDLAGDGQLDLVELEPPTPGFYERTEEGDWHSFISFRSLPNVDWSDPNLRFVDLTGDGHADVLVTEQHVFTWYRSQAEEGFAAGQRVPQPGDEERGPRLVFADVAQSIYLADMSGDGLVDLVRIRNGEVCYWPNLGYGRFGAKVAMDNAPWFDAPDQFDQRRIRLADIDGSGVTDVIYLGGDGVHLYFNQSGNGFVAPYALPAFPPIDNVASIQTADLLGNGTACLVWSSPLPAAATRPLRYVDLMGGTKPHLLVKASNNLGAETHIRYVASTQFYLQDKLAGRPWITRLPFPVHVVERVETHDRISRNRFVARYAYHHGYFDGIEREFRGFGLVEQWDTEEFAALAGSNGTFVPSNIDAASHVPPVLTRTWFHTGVHLGGAHISDFFAGLLTEQDVGEYYREPGLSDDEARALLLDDTVLPAGLSADEQREACRALKGVMLRQEIYALDGSERQPHSYTVTEQNFTIRCLQPQGGNPHAVFFTHARESINYHYERNPTDPRVSHALTLQVDDFGNVLQSAAISYGRRRSNRSWTVDDRAEQALPLATVSDNRVTNPVDTQDDYRVPLPCDSRSYELSGFMPTGAAARLSMEQVLAAVAAAEPLDYEQPASGDSPQKRLIEHARTLYRSDDLASALPLGSLQALALPFETYKLALTAGLVSTVFDTRVVESTLGGDGGYVHSEGDAHWWIPSGRVFYSPGPADDPGAELACARAHFFLPQRYRNPFHSATTSTETLVSYDAYDLLLLETRDAVGNRITAGERDAAGNVVANGNDYRVLQPCVVSDANRNRTAQAFDALGMVVGTAVMGKPLPDAREGDLLEGFEVDLADDVVLSHLANPLAEPHAILQRATTRLVYDLDAYRRSRDQPQPQPSVVYTLARETHDADLPPGEATRIQHSFAYSDGFGREIQKKLQAESGPAPTRDENGNIVVGADGQPVMTPFDVEARWVGSGWTVFNNKGKPVRQLEPFFTDTHRFEADVRIGVSPVLCYDPLERVVATLHPNHTWQKVRFDAWRQETWDVSDTVLVDDPGTDADVGDFFARLPRSDYWPTWYALRAHGELGPQEQIAADKGAVHAATPAIAHADVLGRTFLTIVHNRFKYGNAAPNESTTEEFHCTRVKRDIEGNQREVIDALDRLVMRYDYDMLGNRIRQASMDAGERWLLGDASGKTIRAWDSLDHEVRTAYDALRRTTGVFLREGDAAEVLVERTEYGEAQSNADADNLRGKVFRVFDQAGTVTNESYDFKGNALRSQRQLALEYKTTLDWSASVALGGAYATETRYDALNRPTALTTPDNSTIRPGYNQANFLERIDANLRGADSGGEPVWTTFVRDVDYNAKGQRTRIEYGNGAVTHYGYDPATFRLISLRTQRNATGFPDDCQQPPPTDWPGCQVQNLSYVYDPAGNITHIRDDAQQTIYFRNQRVEPSADYTYDALYRLIEATGREHLGQAGGAPLPHSYNDALRIGLLQPGDGGAMGRYAERYVYDAVGNFLSMQHSRTDASTDGWTRGYTYSESSSLERDKVSNRLSSTTIGATTESYSEAGDGYDAHGNMLRMPQLQTMQWDFRDQLRMAQRQVVNPDDEDGRRHHGERTWYVYDSTGQRVRKLTELATGAIKDERIYLGGYEIYRRHGSDPLERETLHIMDDKQRVALIETRTLGTEPGVPRQLIRYQCSDHLASATLELDDEAQIISYEEYTPYGSTSYQAVRNWIATPKRYRYTAKERDEETGLHYHGARYYAAWLGQWTSCDPAGMTDGPNPYAFVSERPIVSIDPSGTQTVNELQGHQREVLKLSYIERIQARIEFENRYKELPPAQELQWLDLQKRMEIDEMPGILAILPFATYVWQGMNLVRGETISGLEVDRTELALSMGEQALFDITMGLLLRGLFGSSGTPVKSKVRPARTPVKEMLRSPVLPSSTPRPDARRTMAGRYGERGRVRAPEVSGRPDDQWVHLKARSHGAPDSAENLGAASAGTNYTLKHVVEDPVRTAVRSGVRMETEVIASMRPGIGKFGRWDDVIESITYRVWREGEQILEGVLSGDLPSLSIEDVHWWTKGVSR